MPTVRAAIYAALTVTLLLVKVERIQKGEERERQPPLRHLLVGKH